MPVGGARALAGVGADPLLVAVAAVLDREGAAPVRGRGRVHRDRVRVARGRDDQVVGPVQRGLDAAEPGGVGAVERAVLGVFQTAIALAAVAA